jgi:hypothetical protein
MSTVSNQHNFRFPSYADSPDVPKDISYLAKDIADYIDANPGPQGPAGTLSIGEVTALPNGSTPIINNVGTSTNAILDIAIPVGLDGIVGGPGPANVLTIGDVAAGVDENDYDVNISGTSPSQVLNIVLPRGLQGIQGIQGPAGPTTVAVGTTTTLSPGTNASVTNTGTNTNAVFAFSIPRGATGATGATGPAGADGANATLDPIATTISLNPVPTSFSYGVTSDWYPLASNTYNIGIPAGSGVTARYWKTIYSNTGTIQTSDQRLKMDIESSNLGLDFINNLNPVSYKFIEGSKDLVDGEYVSVPGSRTHYGLIAQEVKQVLDESGVEDFGGWVKLDLSDEDSDQALRYEEFISPLIKAVQELTARVKALEEA